MAHAPAEVRHPVAAAMEKRLEEAETAGDDVVELWNTMVYQHLGDAGEAIEVSAAEQLPAARVSMRLLEMNLTEAEASAMEVNNLECLKAER